MGYGDMSCTGHPTISTPHLDALASEGTRFTQWYSGFHVCSPSRASMMTGRLPIRSGTAGAYWIGGVFRADAKGGIPANETTVAELVRRVGYATLAVGKWHLGQQPQFLPTAHGFDEYFGIPYSVDMGVSAWHSSTDGPLPLLHNLTVVEQPVDLNTLETRYVEKASAFIRQHAAARKPFLLYLAFSHVHIPDFVAPSFCNASARGRFGDAMEELDSHIGEVMSVVKDSGVDNDTLVFFTSDNGPWLIQLLAGGSAGHFFEGKQTNWEGGIRVPGIVRWPGHVKAGVVSKALVATYDIFPTVASLSGAGVPADRIIDGRDLTGLLGGLGGDPDRCLFHWKGTPSKGLPPQSDDPKPGLWAVRCGAYKAHFVTSCSVMHLHGDKRCGSDAAYGATESSGEAVSRYLAAFRACTAENPADLCALEMSSKPVKHDPPLLFNVNHDPSEMYPLPSGGAEYKAALDVILAAKREHEASLTPVPNQVGLGDDPSLGVCCSVDTTPACVCNPENYEPQGGVCSPVFPPTASQAAVLTV